MRKLRRCIVILVLTLSSLLLRVSPAAAEEYCYNDERYSWTHWQSDGQYDFYDHYVVCTDGYSYWDDYGPYHWHAYFTPRYSP